MKHFNLIFYIFLILIFGGCSNNNKPLPPREVIKIQKVLISTPCKLPKITCDFRGTGFEPTNKLMACIILQKRALEVCDSKPYLVNKNGILYKVKSSIVNEVGIKNIINDIEKYSTK